MQGRGASDVAVQLSDELARAQIPELLESDDASIRNVQAHSSSPRMTPRI